MSSLFFSFLPVLSYAIFSFFFAVTALFSTIMLLGFTLIDLVLIAKFSETCCNWFSWIASYFLQQLIAANYS